MSTEQRLGILLPEDGPPDYEWYTLDQSLDYQDGFLPALEIGKVASDGYHETRALTALGSVERLTPIGNDLVNRGANALVWACTSASFIGGLDWAEAQASELRRRLGMPVTSTSLAFRHALSTLEYYEVDVLSAYPDEVTECLIKFLHECDVRVRQASALDCAYAADSHELDIVGEVRAFAAKRKILRRRCCCLIRRSIHCR